jgi:hypothetical protein
MHATPRYTLPMGLVGPTNFDIIKLHPLNHG